MARLILDTGVLVAAVRGQLDLSALADADDAALPAVVVAEYLAGTLLDPDPGRTAAQRALLEDVLQVLTVHDYDLNIAGHHSVLLAHVQQRGTPLGAHDLIVAATARASGRTILTTDERARFDELPDVDARVVGG